MEANNLDFKELIHLTVSALKTVIKITRLKDEHYMRVADNRNS